MSKHAAIESDYSVEERTGRAAAQVERLTRWRDDFPTPGIRFADLTPVFADPQGFRAVIDCLAACAPDADLVAGVDARGFLLGAGVAAVLGTGVLAVRKAGKLRPGPVAGIHPRIRHRGPGDSRRRGRAGRATRPAARRCPRHRRHPRRRGLALRTGWSRNRFRGSGSRTRRARRTGSARRLPGDVDRPGLDRVDRYSVPGAHGAPGTSRIRAGHPV